MNRDYRYFVALAIALYTVGGAALGLNTLITIGALSAAGIPDAIAALVALLFSSTAIAMGVFLTSPSEWGEIWDQFAATAAKAGKGRSKTPQAISAAVLGLLVVALLAYLAGCYWGDWISTWDRISGGAEPTAYHYIATVALIVGPECSFVLAYAQWRQSRHQRLKQATIAASEDPQIAYLTATRRNGLRAAAAAASQQAQQPRR